MIDSHDLPKWNHTQPDTLNGYSTNKHNCVLLSSIVVFHRLQQDTLFVEMTERKDKDKTIVLDSHAQRFSQTRSTLRTPIRFGILSPRQPHTHHSGQIEAFKHKNPICLRASHLWIHPYFLLLDLTFFLLSKHSRNRSCMLQKWKTSLP
jgi:hypothetical protein